MKKTVLSLLFCGLACGLPLVAAAADDAPDQVTLDLLAELYAPVEFDHAMHQEITGGRCAACHHHATGETPLEGRCRECHKENTPAADAACSACHPASRYDAAYLKQLESNPYRYHTDVVGLKGAYHRLCLDCHQQQDAPVGCQDCHPRNEAGDRRFFSGAFAPAEGDRQDGHH
ncbi:MAG: cytochrome c3 family protein [Thermodesulfobacteriota bacterium]